MHPDDSRRAEVHIASCVAYVRPDAIEATCRAITGTGLAEVPRTDPRGRLVVLIEKTQSAGILDAIEAIRALPGVLAIHLVYQHAEPASALEETP